MDPSGHRRPSSSQRPLRSPPSSASSQALSPSSPSPSIDSSSSEYNIPDDRAPVLHHQKSATSKSADNDVPPLLDDEIIAFKYEKITFLTSNHSQGQESIKGDLYGTNYKLYFRSNSTSGGSRDAFPVVLEVPWGFVSHVQKIGGQRQSSYGLEIVCKDIRTLRFALNKLEIESQDSTRFPSRKDIFNNIKFWSFPKFESLFAFSYKASVRPNSDVRGWNVYNPEAEYERQRKGIDQPWKLKHNDKFELCDTYPKLLWVPKKAKDSDLREVAKFRSRARLPVLSWIHPDGAAICRCSQPLVGMSNARSKEDEDYIKTIMEANPQHYHQIFIMDARPKVNAMANIVNGGGYETDYDCVNLEFLDIHNIHVMRESLRKLRDLSLLELDDPQFYSKLDNTQWRTHLHAILDGAAKIAYTVEDKKASVIVHCSDGWDRTPQLTSLAMLFLDPYYRTLKGFQVLIEKEWVSFGHKFAQRIGHGVDKHNDNDRSPVFLQFIDCVYQVTTQFPNKFEFNSDFLILILHHLYSCLFGNFLYNTDKEREEKKLTGNTHSLWYYVNSNRETYSNPQYLPSKDTKAIFPNTNKETMKFWRQYYCQWSPKNVPQDCLKQRQKETLPIKEQLRGKLEALKKELETKRHRNHEEMGAMAMQTTSEQISESNPGPPPLLTRFESVNI